MREALIFVKQTWHAVAMTTQGSGEPPPGTPLTVGELIRQRLKAARARRDGISARQFAAHLATLTPPGETRLSANVLQNLEVGRRQQAVTVEELLLLAAGLSVPPEYFLIPPPGETLQITPTVALGSAEFLDWLRGRHAPDIPGTDAAHYAAVSAEELGDSRLSGNAALKAEYLRRASGMLDDFLADHDEIIGKTREQVRDMLGDLRTAVADGADKDQILAQIDQYLDKLPTD